MTNSTEPMHDIAHIGPVELHTPELQKSLEHFRDVYGMEVVHQEGQSVYLRGWGDYQLYCLKLTESPQAGIALVGMRAWGEAALQRRVASLEGAGYGLGWTEDEYGLGPVFRFTDPAGHVFGLYSETEKYEPTEEMRSAYINQYQRYTGRGASVRRIDHVNLFARDVRANSEFLQQHLGYRLYETNIREDGLTTGAWLSRTIAAHELIYVLDPSDTDARLHHVAFWVDTREEVLRGADILVENGVKIETGPSKHSAAQAFFLYSLEPGGNRCEITHGGYLVYDVDPKPVVRDAAALKRGMSWGHKLPDTFEWYGTPDVGFFPEPPITSETQEKNG